jgi:hypothetical protein
MKEVWKLGFCVLFFRTIWIYIQWFIASVVPSKGKD